MQVFSFCLTASLCLSRSTLRSTEHSMPAFRLQTETGERCRVPAPGNTDRPPQHRDVEDEEEEEEDTELCMRVWQCGEVTRRPVAVDLGHTSSVPLRGEGRCRSEPGVSSQWCVTGDRREMLHLLTPRSTQNLEWRSLKTAWDVKAGSGCPASLSLYLWISRTFADCYCGTL